MKINNVSTIKYRLMCIQAVARKEFLEMRQECLTYFFIIAIPFLQAIFFGYVINNDPKFLPTIVLTTDHSPFVNSIMQGLENTQYFQITGVTNDQQKAEALLQKGNVKFILNIPDHFSRTLIRGEQPHILLEADATDPVTILGALSAANTVVPQVLNHYFQGNNSHLIASQASFVLDTHGKYNPKKLTLYHVSPGLVAIILTSVLVMLTSVSIASEYEQGTFETLLTTPVKAFDVILGKLLPHFAVGFVLYFLLLAVSYYFFNVPFYGSLILLSLIAIPFTVATLGIGLIASSLSRSQFSAVTYANLYILPSILLTGFSFPFYGMPKFAQWISELLPTTHFMRITNSIMLKNAGFSLIWPDIWPLIVIMVIILMISAKTYRKNLD